MKSPKIKLSERLRLIPLEQKVNIFGGVSMILSLFLTWYSDFDSYGGGDSFNGFTGPLYFAGVTLFTLSAASLILSALSMNQTEEKLKAMFKGHNVGNFQFSSGIVAFYILFLMNSVYFHPKFGLNITRKESGIGVVIGLIACSLMTIGGFLISRSHRGEIEKNLEATRKSLQKTGIKKVLQSDDTPNTNYQNRRNSGLNLRPSPDLYKNIQEEKVYELTKAAQENFPIPSSKKTASTNHQNLNSSQKWRMDL